MKKILLLSFALLFSLQSFAQSSYDRVGLTILHTNYSDGYSSKIDDIYNSYVVNARYDNTVIPTKSINMEGSRLFYKNDLQGKRDYYANTNEATITEKLISQKIGQQIIASLFNRNSDGIMNFSTIHQRGQYNATDEEYNMSAATKRGVEALKEAGEKLIANSYFIVYDNQNIRLEGVKGSDGKISKYYYGHIVAYLYKVEWNDVLLNSLFECWIDESSTPEEVASKKDLFDNIDVPITFIQSYSSPEYAIKCNGTSTLTNQLLFKTQTQYIPSDATPQEVAFITLIIRGIEMSNDIFEKNNEALSLQTYLYDIKPLRAKIGTKEGIRANNAFFAYEYIQQNDGDIVLKKKGLIKATNNIADNSRVSTGDFEPTEFYQFTGGKLEPGLTLKEKKLLNAAFQLGYVAGSGGGVNVGLELDFYSKKYLQLFGGVDFNVGDVALCGDIFLGYGFRMSNFQLYPYAGILFDTLFASNLSDEEKKTNYAAGGTVGIKTNINIIFPIQLFAKIAYNFAPLEGATYRYYKGYRNVNGINAGFGVRYYF